MNLLLWRHAEATALTNALPFSFQLDLQRELTPRGQRQAERIAHWLRQQAPAGIRLLTSPATRCRQTAHALTADAQICPALAPDADVGAVLAALDWPEGPDTLVIGHQPWIGNLAALLLTGAEQPLSVRKGSLWWLSSRSREDRTEWVVRTVISPDLL